MTYRLYGTYLTAQVQEILENTDDFLSVAEIVIRLGEQPNARSLKRRVRRALVQLELECNVLKEIRVSEGNIQSFIYKIACQ